MKQNNSRHHRLCFIYRNNRGTHGDWIGSSWGGRAVKIVLKNKGRLMSSILLALFLNCKSISDGLISMIGLSIMNYIYIFVAVVSLLILIAKREIKSSILADIILIWVVACYALSVKISSVKPIYFVVYFLLPFIFSMLEYDWEALLRYTSLMVVPLVIFQKEIFALNEINNNIEMGTSYMFLPAIVSAYLYFIYYRNACSWWMWIASLVNAFYLWKVIQFGSRGPILAIVLTIIVSTHVKFDKEKNRFYVKWLRLMAFVVLMVVLVLGFENILVAVQRALFSKGVSFRFIDKMINLLQKDNLSNGRVPILKAAYEGWLERPLLGHGISTFDYYTGFIYPHNLIMQLLFDGGIFLALLTIVPTVIKVKRLLPQMNYEQYVSLLFISMISIPGALFSGDLFRSYRWWIFAFFILNETLIESHFSKANRVH